MDTKSHQRRIQSRQLVFDRSRSFFNCLIIPDKLANVVSPSDEDCSRGERQPHLRQERLKSGCSGEEPFTTVPRDLTESGVFSCLDESLPDLTFYRAKVVKEFARSTTNRPTAVPRITSSAGSRYRRLCRRLISKSQELDSLSLLFEPLFP